ncbi:MAG TPA: serine--tRNA ligase [Candidatus Nanoarchaeia archaeon]|nr:serine--tRNA ligase [Candidatus Nanoarchaeia archaeon]
MLDIKFIRENPDAVRRDLKKRNDEEKLKWLLDLLDKEEEYRKLLGENQKLRASKNVLAQEVNALKKAGKDIAQKLQEVKDLPNRIKESDDKIAIVKEKIDFYLMRIPNILHDSVPAGKDGSENIVVKEVGAKPTFDFELKPHGELLVEKGLANFEKAAEVCGQGFYYLLGDAARLEMALSMYAVEKLVAKGYQLVSPPLMLRRAPYEGVTDLADFENMMYKIDGEDLFLIATSEHPIAALHKGETFDEKSLPIKMVGFSPCFRKELGSHSIDTKGIFRVHHFNKVEQFVFCRPQDSWKFHEELIANAEEVFKELGIPYRVVNICTGDIGIVAAKKYDIEAWMPRENTYREVVSCSNCTSYQATRLGIKFTAGNEKEYIHTLNSTVVATSRALRAIIENFQQKDGKVKVPKPLQKYLGKEFI